MDLVSVTMNHLQEELARIRQQIADEYSAVSRVFHDFTQVSKHEYITARQEGSLSFRVKVVDHSGISSK